jgi:hypothetical protein
MTRPLYSQQKDPVTTVQEAWWATGPFWTGVENLANIMIRFLDCPANSKSLSCPDNIVYISMFGPSIF